MKYTVVTNKLTMQQLYKYFDVDLFLVLLIYEFILVMIYILYVHYTVYIFFMYSSHNYNNDRIEKSITGR